MKPSISHRHWFDYVMLAIRALWFTGGLKYMISEQDSYEQSSNLIGVTGGVWGAIIFFTIAFLVPPILYIKQSRLALYPVIAEVVLCVSFYSLYEANNLDGFATFYLPIMMMAYMSGSRIAFAISLSTLIAYPFLVDLIWNVGLRGAGDQIVDGLIFLAIGFGFRKTIDAFLQIKVMNGVIGEQNRTLEIYAKQIEKLTLTQERNRLSRELHDTVGHTFTTTITGMDAVSYLIDADPEEAKKTLRELLAVTRNGLDEVRQHIHEIASGHEERSLSLVLSGLAKEFASYTGTEIDFSSDGEEFAVSENIRSTLYRCLQEALTNAKRHGLATSIEVKLSYLAKEVQLEIQDNGKGTNQLEEGFGLTAMRERVSNLQGQLLVVSGEGKGTLIECSIPILGDRE